MNQNCQLLKDFYVKVFETESYKNYVKSYNFTNKIAKNLENSKSAAMFFCLSILASIYLSLICFFRGEYRFFALLPLSIILLIITKIFEKIYIKKLEAAYEPEAMYRKEVEDIMSQTEVPQLPDDKFTPEHFNNLISIFESGRAETFKEALIIYEQDAQAKKLLAEQQATRKEISKIRKSVNSIEHDISLIKHDVRRLY